MCRCAPGAFRHSSYRVAGEGSMWHFVVSFKKDVLGDNGRQVEICQRTVEIDATSEGVATELAKQRFCKAERLCEWSLHADRIQIKPAELSGLEARPPNLRFRALPPKCGDTLT